MEKKITQNFSSPVIQRRPQLQFASNNAEFNRP